MKVLSVIFQWLVVIGLSVYGVWFFIQPQPETDHHPDTWNSWNGFMAISYESIARKDTFTTVSAKRFLEHMNALKEAGYNPVTPEDVEHFLAGKGNLPKRAVMIMVEDGRRQSYLLATPVLRETGFLATMFVPIGSSSFWDNEFLNKKDIERMSKTPNWRIGNLGIRARDNIPTNGEGEVGPFLTRTMWRGERSELDEEFRTRIENEYAKSTDYLKEFTGSKIDAFIFPFGDYGQFKSAHPLAKELNSQQVSEHYRIAFVGAGNAYNGAHSNPYRLQRFDVTSDMSAADLIERLQGFLPRTNALIQTTRATDWVIEGEAEVVNGGHLKLNDNALLWLRGSDDWSDVEGVLNFSMSRGEQLVAYFRYESPNSFLRIRMEYDRFYIQEQLGDRLLNLVTHELTDREFGRYHLEFRIRGRRGWIRHNGNFVAGPVYIAKGDGRGRIGFSYEGPGLVIDDMSIAPLHRRAVVITEDESRPSQEQLESSSYVMHRTSLESLQDYVRLNRGDIIRASRFDVITVPMLSGGSIPSQLEMVDATQALIDDIKTLSLQEFMPLLALDSDYAGIGDMLHLEGFDIIWIGDLDYVFDLVNRGMVRADDMLFITRYNAQDQSKIERLLHYINPARILIEADDLTRESSLLANAVLYSPVREFRVNSFE